MAILMILFGLAEVATGFTHNFLGLLSTAPIPLSTYAAAGIGALYAVGGVLLLTMKRPAVLLALVCLVVVIAGRVALVLMGLYPVTSFLQTVSIVIGTTLAISFLIYIGLEWPAFK